MKRYILIALVMLALLPLLRNFLGLNNGKIEKEIHGLAVTGLKSLFMEAGAKSTATSDNELVVNGQEINVLPRLERLIHDKGKWICGVRFHMQIDGKEDRALITGSVGIGDSKEDAKQTAVDEWLALFGRAFVPALLKSAGVDSSGYTVYPGPMGIRGQAPGEWVDGTVSMHKKILTALKPVLATSSATSSWTTIHLMIAVNADGTITGESRKDGEVSTQVLALLIQLPWPKTTSYMFKQHYILRH